MRAAQVDAQAAAPRLVTMPEPTAGPGETVVMVRAAGVNPSDWLATVGFLGSKVFPRVVGNEGIGMLGERRVYFERSVVPHGSFAERAVTVADRTIDIDDRLDDAAAVSLGISSIAGWLAVEERAALVPGEQVLVLGASGPVGQAAVQAARLLGAGRIVVAARHRESLVRLVEVGLADDMVDLGLDTAHLGEAFRDSARDHGYDLVIDPLFGNILPKALSAMTRTGRAVVLGRSAGERATLPWIDLASRAVLSYNNVETDHDRKAAAYRRLMTHAVAGDFSIPTRSVRLDDIASLWDELNASPHAKLVVIP